MQKISTKPKEYKVEQLEQKEFFVKEILDSREVGQNLFSPSYRLIYEKVQWRKVLLESNSTLINEYNVKIEQCIKLMELKNESSSLICVGTYLLREGQLIDDLVKEIKSNFNTT